MKYVIGIMTILSLSPAIWASSDEGDIAAAMGSHALASHEIFEEHLAKAQEMAALASVSLDEQKIDLAKKQIATGLKECDIAKKFVSEDDKPKLIEITEKLIELKRRVNAY